MHMTFQPYQDLLEDGLSSAPIEQATPEPPADLLQRALAAFRRQRARTARRRSITVTPPPFVYTPVALGLRGAPVEDQFLYAIDSYDVDVCCSYDPTLQSFVLQGQILAHNLDADTLEGLEVRLIAKQTPAGQRVERLRLTDALGQFTFSYVTEGEYTIALLLAEEELLLDAIVVKQQPSNHL